MAQTVEIMDTTLRDGEQTSGVSFSAREKLSIAQFLLREVGIDRIEVASARVSSGEAGAVRAITDWASSEGMLSRVECLGFVDGGKSIAWIRQAGGEVLNLLCKGSLKHVTLQLRRTPEEHLADVRREVSAALSEGMQVNVYLEDWSNGMLHSRDYVYRLIDGLADLPIRRFLLPDTLGILDPFTSYDLCREVVERYPDFHFDFHAHNDYDFANADTFAALRAGFRGVHTTVNGLGERAGNAVLTSVVAMIHDHTDLTTHCCEKKLYQLSKLVETYSGVRIPSNKPVVGDNVFTQCAGVHADGDNKSNLYYNDLLPERFGRVREYALGKMSGKANIRKNLESLGISIDEPTIAKVTEQVIRLGDRKQVVTLEDLPYIVADVLKHEPRSQRIRMVNYSVSSTDGLRPMATVRIAIDGVEYERSSAGDGQYDAFSKALWQIYDSLGMPTPELQDYVVVIPPGGRTDALVHTTITWKFADRIYKTHALDADQTAAAIRATLKMLNLIDDPSATPGA